MKPDLSLNSSTVVTDFSLHLLPVMMDAVAEYGNPNVVVVDQPTEKMRGQPGGSLHCNGHFDLADFWTIYHRLALTKYVHVVNHRTSDNLLIRSYFRGAFSFKLTDEQENTLRLILEARDAEKSSL